VQRNGEKANSKTMSRISSLQYPLCRGHPKIHQSNNHTNGSVTANDGAKKIVWIKGSNDWNGKND
jgi:hypothetical protein